MLCVCVHAESGGVRPFGVSLLMAGYDDNGPQLYQIDPSGSYFAWKASAIGKNMTNAKTFLEKRYSEVPILASSCSILYGAVKSIVTIGTENAVFHDYAQIFARALVIDSCLVALLRLKGFDRSKMTQLSWGVLGYGALQCLPLPLVLAKRSCGTEAIMQEFCRLGSSHAGSSGCAVEMK